MRNALKKIRIPPWLRHWSCVYSCANEPYYIVRTNVRLICVGDIIIWTYTSWTLQQMLRYNDCNDIVKNSFLRIKGLRRVHRNVFFLFMCVDFSLSLSIHLYECILL